MLVFLRRSADAEQIQIGPLRIDAEARDDALLVVDGRQRLVALVEVFANDEESSSGLAALTDRRIPVAVLSEPEAEAVDIFRRLNAARPLESIVEFSTMVPRSVDEVVAELHKLSFGRLPRDLVERLAAFFAAGGDREAFERLLGAFRRAVIFVKTVGVPHFGLLPHPESLLALAIFFDRFPASRPRSAVLLGRWLWRGWITGALARVDLEALKRCVNDRDEEQALQELLHQVEREPELPLELEPFDPTSARTKVQLLALASGRWISEATRDALAAGRLDIESEIRRDGLEAELRRAFLARTAPEHSDRPSIASLIVEDAA